MVAGTDVTVIRENENNRISKAETSYKSSYTTENQDTTNRCNAFYIFDTRS